MRRFGRQREQGRRYVLRPGAYAVLIRGQDMLITHQAAPFNEFQLPGGGIDPGESGIVALYREVMEETGWKIAAPKRLGAYRRFSYMPEYDLWAEKVCHIFTARPVRRISAPLEPDHQAIWTDVDTALRILCNEGDRHFLRNHLRLGL
ncbi:NUDIX hydrolase [Aliiroseovarius sp. F47248L]|uniref:NUDIX domain-containing protein n=1 Tax=Aliiroseovarius sp. F47248L TaxID=2926420 RepID=UPI001FF3708F|nr:NUDIX hydrolase [Aliiroseovarius sp. F47248L]MCK0140145.1 NUDIX hydrolase [Aliiroseovarius sp. F47248L]